ncbi:MAG: molybdopterin-dependent oxidoreductase, partial [Dehalococcoidia bacterium]|nr:molybdopterin-dependent oxidoreductase [Dehalococcoidia bacterium]
QPHVGGSFGVKVRLWPFYPISAYLSRKAGGRPVRIIFSREEEYFAGRPREATVIYLKTAAKKDGTLLGRQVRLIYDNGAYSEEGPQMMKNMCYRSDSLYRLPSTRVEAIGAYTTTTPIGAFRPWGNLQMTFALESQMDSIANELGIDPVELRIKNASRAGDVSVHGWRLDSCGLVECLDKTDQAMDWQKRRANCQPLHGIGVAAGIHTGDWRYLGANFSGSNASVEVQEDGRITVVSGEAEFGQGSHTTFAQIAAEVLQVPMEHIEVTYPDTDRTPFALGPWGTRVTIGGGWAVKLAAEDARSKLLEAAADLLEANPNDLDISEGKISVKGTDSRALSFGDVAKYALYRANGGLITGRGTHDPKTDPPDPTKQTSPCLAWSFASCIAEIEIDRKTGQVNILDMASCTDGGTI